MSDSLENLNVFLKDIYEKSIIEMFERQNTLFLEQSQYMRKVDHEIVHPVSAKRWKEYHKIKKAYKKVRQSEFFVDGGPDYGSEIEEPRPIIEYVWAETVEEWQERIAKLPRVTYTFEIKKLRLNNGSTEL